MKITRPAESAAPASPLRPDRQVFLSWPVTALAFILLLLCCLPALLLPPGRDTANFLCLGREVALGARPYTDIWDNKPPGMFLLYAGLARLAAAGDITTDVPPVILAALGAVLVTFLFLLRLQRATPDRFIAGTMAFAAALLLPLAAGYWLLGQAEGFALPLLVLAYLLGQRFAGRPTAAIALAAGLVAGLLPLLKPQFILAALLPLITQVLGARRAGARPPALLMLAVGLLVPGTLALLWLSASGSLADAWDAVVLFNFEYRTSGVGFFRFWLHLFSGAPHYAILLAGLLAGSIFMFASRRTRSERTAALWWLGSFLAIAVAGRYWLYHWLIIIPATLELARVAWRHFAPRQSPAMRWSTAIVMLLLATPAALTPLHDIGNWPGSEDFINLVNSNSEPYKIARIANLLRPQLDGTDRRVQMFGYDGMFHLIAGSRPATRFFYDFPLYALPPENTLGQRLRASFLRELSDNPPTFIVVAGRDGNPVERESSDQQLATWPEMQVLLRGNYRVSNLPYGWSLFTRMNRMK